MIKKGNPRYEDHFDLYDRAKLIKHFLAEYLRTHPLDQETQEKYGVISHSRIIATMTSKGVNKEDGSLIDYSWFSNCEMRAFNDY